MVIRRPHYSHTTPPDLSTWRHGKNAAFTVYVIGSMIAFLGTWTPFCVHRSLRTRIRDHLKAACVLSTSHDHCWVHFRQSWTQPHCCQNRAVQRSHSLRNNHRRSRILFHRRKDSGVAYCSVLFVRILLWLDRVHHPCLGCFYLTEQSCDWNEDRNGLCDYRSWYARWNTDIWFDFESSWFHCDLGVFWYCGASRRLFIDSRSSVTWRLDTEAENLR